MKTPRTSAPVHEGVSGTERKPGLAAGFDDRRSSTATQRRLGELSSQSRQAGQLQALSGMANQSVQRKIKVPGAVEGTFYEESKEFTVHEKGAADDVEDYQPVEGAANPRKDYAASEAPEDRDAAGYLVNISSMNVKGDPKAEKQGDIEAKHSVKRYNEGFANAVDAMNRLRIVVNVNQYDNVKTPTGAETPETALTTALGVQRADGEITGAPGKTAVVGFLWGGKWKRSDNQEEVTAAEVRAAYQAQRDAPGANIADLESGHDRPPFRYGQMREFTFKHAQTVNFKTHFDSRHLPTFVHLGDGDIVSAKVAGKGVYDRMDTWRRASAANKAKKLIGGGVEYKGRDQGGDAPVAEGPFVKMLSDIDMDNRDSMAGVDARAPWMTEPNTFIDYDKLPQNKNWKNMKNYQTDIGSALGSLVTKEETAYNAKDLSIVSSANTHPVKAANLAAPTRAEFIRELLVYKDHSMEPEAWVGRIATTLELSDKKRKAFAEKLCIKVMREKVGAISNDDAHLDLKNVFLNFKSAEYTDAWSRVDRVAAVTEPNVKKAEDFADALVVQIKAAWAKGMLAYNFPA